MGTDTDIHSDLPIPPGEYLEEVIEELGMTKEELARRMGRPAPKLSAIFKGTKTITPDTALQLEKVVGIPAHIWSGLEAEYRLTLARQAQHAEARKLREEGRMATAFCYRELARLGWVKATRNAMERAQELQRFFGVASLRNVTKVPLYGVTLRQASHSRKAPSPQALTAWLRIGERTAQDIQCSSFDRQALNAALPELRAMTHRRPEVFQPRLHKLLARSGVAFVFCPHLPKTYVQGATFWRGGDKAVLMMTIRGKWVDIFWFSFFHELAHLLLHGRSRLFLEFADGNPKHQQQEREADRFAEDALLPRDAYEAFSSQGRFSRNSVNGFAAQVAIAPGIVVGRLQNDGYLEKSWLNGLRTQYPWTVET